VIDVVDPIADPENTPPVAADDNFEGFAAQSISSSLVGNDSDPDGDVITIADPATGAPTAAALTVTTTQGGSLVIQPNGQFTYTPAAGFIGIDTFDYSVIDPSGATDDATVSFTVTGDPDPAVNDVPDANDDITTTQVNTQSSDDALANDTDPNGDPLTVTEIEGVAVVAGTPTAVTTVNGGMLEINDDGSYIYTPAAGFIGTESVEYRIDDGMGGTDVATITLSVFNMSPQVEDDINNTSVNQPTDGNVLTNDTSEPGDVLVIGDGSGNPLTGPVTLTTDQGGTICVESELTIEVIDTTANPDNTPPAAASDNFETFSDPAMPGTLSSDLLGNDGDPDGDVIEVLAAGGVPSGTAFTTVNGGTVVVSADGTFDYTPAAGFIGVDSFEYTIADPSGATDDAMVVINVQPDSDPSVNDAPDANDDASIVQMNTQSTGNALDNDTDPNMRLTATAHTSTHRRMILPVRNYSPTSLAMAMAVPISPHWFSRFMTIRQSLQMI